MTEMTSLAQNTKELRGKAKPVSSAQLDPRSYPLLNSCRHTHTHRVATCPVFISLSIGLTAQGDKN